MTVAAIEGSLWRKQLQMASEPVAAARGSKELVCRAAQEAGPERPGTAGKGQLATVCGGGGRAASPISSRPAEGRHLAGAFELSAALLCEAQAGTGAPVRHCQATLGLGSREAAAQAAGRASNRKPINKQLHISSVRERGASETERGWDLWTESAGRGAGAAPLPAGARDGSLPG